MQFHLYRDLCIAFAAMSLVTSGPLWARTKAKTAPPATAPKSNNTSTRKPTSRPATQPQDLEVQEAAKKVQTAEQSLNDVVKKLQSAFEASPEYTAARKKELTAAEAANHAAQAAVLAKLAKDPAYVSAVELQGKGGQGRAGKAGRWLGQSPELATAVMEAGKDKAKIENDAFAADPPSTESKAKVLAVGATVAKLHEKFTQSIKQDAGWQAARKAVDDAGANYHAVLSSEEPRPLSLKLSREPERPDRPPLVNPPPPPTDSGWAGNAKGHMWPATNKSTEPSRPPRPAKAASLPRTAPSA